LPGFSGGKKQSKKINKIIVIYRFLKINRISLPFALLIFSKTNLSY